MTREAPLLPSTGSIIDGKYRVEALLGAGSMGAVFQVLHNVTAKRFAVKWLLPGLIGDGDAVERFMREAKIAAHIAHPGVVDIYDVGTDGGSFFMVMELLHGEPLSQRITRERTLSAAETCRLLVPVADGVSAAHRAGVIHRDLKPDNLFICRGQDGRECPKILDFGVSQMRTLRGELRNFRTRDGDVLGTPSYMAPEQVQGLPLDARADVYALGVVLYEMLTGRLPFASERLPDLLMEIVGSDPPPLERLAPHTPPALAQVVATAMARDPAARFESAAALARALDPFVLAEPVRQSAPPAYATLPRTRVSEHPRVRPRELDEATATQRRLPLGWALPATVAAAATLAAALIYLGGLGSERSAVAVHPRAATVRAETAQPAAVAAVAAEALSCEAPTLTRAPVAPSTDACASVVEAARRDAMRHATAAGSPHAGTRVERKATPAQARRVRAARSGAAPTVATRSVAGKERPPERELWITTDDF